MDKVRRLAESEQWDYLRESLVINKDYLREIKNDSELVIMSPICINFGFFMEEAAEFWED